MDKQQILQPSTGSLTPSQNGRNEKENILSLSTDGASSYKVNFVTVVLSVSLIFYLL